MVDRSFRESHGLHFHTGVQGSRHPGGAPGRFAFAACCTETAGFGHMQVGMRIDVVSIADIALRAQALFGEQVCRGDCTRHWSPRQAKGFERRRCVVAEEFLQARIPCAMRPKSRILFMVVSQTEREAIAARRSASGFDGCLRSDAEDAFDKKPLPNYVAFRQPADLAFANDVHGLVCRDRT